MSERYCPYCGQQHPADARFCMYCGYMLSDEPATPAPAAPGADRAPYASPDPGREPGERGLNWAAIGAALLAFIGLRHASRRARHAAIVFVLFMLFFGCPMACGLVSLAVEWLNQLFH